MPQPQVLVSRGRGQEGAEGVGRRRAGERAGQEGGGNILETWGENERTRKRSIRGTLNDRQSTCNQLNIEKVIKQR